MRIDRRIVLVACLLLPALPAISGCSGSKPEAPEAAAPAGSSSGAPAASGTAAPAGGLQPFTAPPLAELDAKAEWIDQPVEDGLKLLQAELAKTKPAITVTAALALKNTSTKNNEEILDALGRLPASDSEVDYEATITRFMRGDVKSTNPVMTSSVEESDVNSLTSYGLFSFDWNLRPFAVSEFVKSWQTSKDSMYDKVVLRDDATWSDGVPITAHDVVFSFKTILDLRIPIPAVRSQTDELRWVEAYDDKTLVFFHKEKSPTNVWKLNFPVIPKHVYEKSIDADTTMQDSDYHVKLENDPIVGGAYKIVKRTRGQEIVLERREDYYMKDGKQIRDKPYFKTVRFRITQDLNVALLALKKGDLDEMALLPEQWVNQTNDDEFYALNTKVRGVEWVYFYFGWNMDEPSAPFFKDKKVREAMGYAFDHDELLNTICYGLYEPCLGIFHPAGWMAPKQMPSPLKRDIAKAEKLLDEAGWIDNDGDGIRDKEINGKPVKFEFTIVCSNVPQRVAMCNLLRQNLEEIGVVCNVRPLEATVLSDVLLKKQFQANFGGWGTGADPSTIKNIWKTGESRNFNKYSNAEVDKLLKEAEMEFDRDKQADLYGKIHMAIYNDHPVTFLYYQHSFYGFNKRLRGYKFSPRGPYHYSPGIGSIWKAVE